MVNERDEIGPNLVPDYLTSVQEGGFYGWPHSYWGQNVDPRAQPRQDNDRAQRAQAENPRQGRLSPEERQALRRQIDEAGHDIYRSRR